MLLSSRFDVMYRRNDLNLLVFLLKRYETDTVIEKMRVMLNAVPAEKRREFVNDRGCAPLLGAIISCTKQWVPIRRNETQERKREVERAVEMIQWLIDNGADVNAQLDGDVNFEGDGLRFGEPAMRIVAGTRPMEFATERRAAESVFQVLRSGAKKRKRSTD